jgi:hypothetical protein
VRVFSIVGIVIRLGWLIVYPLSILICALKYSLLWPSILCTVLNVTVELGIRVVRDRHIAPVRKT